MGHEINVGVDELLGLMGAGHKIVYGEIWTIEFQIVMNMRGTDKYW